MSNEFVIIGAGPAGLTAALEAALHGVNVTIIDENDRPGGQLFTQTHKFFGSKEHGAGIRGFQIGEHLLKDIERLNVNLLLNTIVYGIFLGNTIMFSKNGEKIQYMKAANILLATGGLEKPVVFKGWTLPGVMGAGAAQTMMNVYRVLPGRKALMVGSGNVGLIVSYQLKQAGCEVVGLLEIMPKISGYKVHASKIRDKLSNNDNSGILSLPELEKTPGFPKKEAFKQGLIAVIECDQDISCNPCESICPNFAIKVGEPITNLPSIDSSKCNGCLKCISICPGLCIFGIKKDFNATEALIYVPYEYTPLPDRDIIVRALDRRGEYICDAKVHKVIKSSKKENSVIIGIKVPKKFFNSIRHFEF